MSKDLIIILILSLITTFAWIGFEAHRAATKTAIPEVKTEYLEPLEPTLEQEALEIIRSSRKVGAFGE